MRAEPRAQNRAQNRTQQRAHAVRNAAAKKPATEASTASRRAVKAAVFSTLALAAWVAAFAPQLEEVRTRAAGFVSKPITKVQIENQWQRVSEAEVTQRLAAQVGVGYFEFDIDAVSASLESLPWVASAELRRIWPDTVALHLKEEVPIAHWGEGKLLNQYGELFAPEDAAQFTDLPKLAGPQQSQERVMQQYKQMSQVLLPVGLRLNGLSLSERGSWKLDVNGIRVEAGRDDVLAKTQRFARFYAQQDRAETARFESVDLRYGHGIAVKLRAGGVAQR